MTVVVTHSTPADGSFSATGAAAWDATHTLSGLGTMAEQDANNVAITGGSISGVTGIPTAAAVGYTINGGGAVITTGTIGVGLRVPFACTITSATLLADQTGSIVVDIWKDTYANYPPTVADSICASAKPTISASNKSVDTTLTGWTVNIAAGDVLYFNVDSCSTITNCVLVLGVTKT